MGVKEKKQKGFTLVELIVAIAIMGILLIIALPQVRKIQEANKDKKYEAYQDAIITGSKLYIDSYTKDLFGNNKSGCVRIKYSELKAKNLVKDFTSKDISCSNDNDTFIEVRKVIDEYKYKINMICKNNKNNKVVYKTKEVVGPAENCSEKPDLEAPIVTISPKNSNNKWYNAKDLVVKIKVSDVSGLNNNISIKYSWYNKTIGKTTVTKNHNFKNKEGAETVSYTIPTSNRPKDAGGKYKLTVTPDNSKGNGIQDALGNKSLTETEAEEYWIDNEKPNFSGSITSADSTFLSKQVKVNLTATDNFTSSSELKVYISNTGYQTGGSWENYSSSIDWTLNGSYDGKSRTLYVSIKDLAGNIEQKTFSYTVYKECTTTIDNGSWYDTGTCSKKCGTGTKPQEKKQTDTYLGTSCPVIEQTVNCNTMDCCSSTYADSWSAWGKCSVSCGGGKQTRQRKLYSNYTKQYCKTETETRNCNTGSCVSASVINGSAYICPEDQNKPTRAECVKGQYNALNITSVRVNGTKVTIQGHLVNNSYYVTWNGYDSNRTVCIATSGNTCKENLCSFSIANQNYAGRGARFCYFNKTIDVANSKWGSGNYRVIVNSGGNAKWRIKTTSYMVNLFRVKK